MMKALTYLALLGFCAALARGEEIKPVHKLSAAEFEARVKADVGSLEIHRNGLRDVIKFMDARPDLFPKTTPKESRLLRREEKEVVWSTWQRFLDYMAALDSKERYYANYFRLKGDAREE